jgi:hypothetical protein
MVTKASTKSVNAFTEKQISLWQIFSQLQFMSVKCTDLCSVNYWYLILTRIWSKQILHNSACIKFNENLFSILQVVTQRYGKTNGLVFETFCYKQAKMQGLEIQKQFNGTLALICDFGHILFHLAQFILPTTD